MKRLLMIFAVAVVTLSVIALTWASSTIEIDVELERKDPDSGCINPKSKGSVAVLLWSESNPDLAHEINQDSVRLKIKFSDDSVGPEVTPIRTRQDEGGEEPHPGIPYDTLRCHFKKSDLVDDDNGGIKKVTVGFFITGALNDGTPIEGYTDICFKTFRGIEK